MKNNNRHRELQRIALYVIVLGWLLPAILLIHIYMADREAFIRLMQEMFSPDAAAFRLRAMIMFMPFLFTTIGYFLNEKAKHLAEEIKTRENFKSAAALWSSLFDSLPYGLLLIDAERTVIKANAYLGRLFKFDAKSASGKKCYDLLHGGDPVAVCPLRKSEAHFEDITEEYYDENLGKWFILNTQPMVSDTGTLFAHSIIDITELKEKEHSLEESRAAFFNMLKDLDFSNKQLQGLLNGLLFAFANALDAKSPWTRGHSERVTAYAISIAKEMGLDEKSIDTLKTAAILHDIGKIGTYDEILDKRGRLTDREFALIKEHPGKGAEILKPIPQLSDVIPIIRHHHERLDGKGYPDGLRGEEIPLLARILCVADSFDSMTADRPYRPAPGKEFAIEEFKRCAGSHFDPQVVEAFLRLLQTEKDSIAPRQG